MQPQDESEILVRREWILNVNPEGVVRGVGHRTPEKFVTELGEFYSDNANVLVQETTVVDTEILKQWVAFRRELRQILHENGIRSNPGWTEQNIVDAFRTLLAQPKDP